MAASPMSPPSGAPLDAPPPLPNEARRRAPVNWMAPPSEEAPNPAAGAMGPLGRLLDINKRMQVLVQQAQAIAPGQAGDWAKILSAIGQVTAQSLAGSAQPEAPGAPGAMMAPQMPTPPGPGAGM